MKNTVKKSVVDWETNFSLDTSKITMATFEPEVYQSISDILEAIRCMYNISGIVNKDFLKVDVPSETATANFDGYHGHLVVIFNTVPDSTFVPMPECLTALDKDFPIKTLKEHTGTLKLINVGPTEPPAPDSPNEHYETTTRSSYNETFLKSAVTTHCPGVTTLVRNVEHREFGTLYNVTFFVKTKNGLYDFWIGQLFISNDSYFTPDSFCKIVPLIELDDSAILGKLN